MRPGMHWGRGPRCGGGSAEFPFTQAHWHHRFGDEGGGGFGVRRPLRFLAWKLQLEDAQVKEFATILSELKTERAQAAVDDRRALTAFADAIAGDSFDTAKADEAHQLRVQSEERVQSNVTKALGRMHALLTPDQRSKLAYLIRTGALLV